MNKRTVKEVEIAPPRRVRRRRRLPTTCMHTNKPSHMSLLHTSRVSSLPQVPSSKPLRITPVKIPELVQIITSHLPLQERLQAQLVNRTWNTHTTYTPDEYQRIFQYAVRTGNITAVGQLLKDRRVDPSAYENHAIQKASEKGHSAVVDRLLQDPRVDPSARRIVPFGDPIVDPSGNEDYILPWAVESDLVAILQDSRADPTANGSFAIQLASENGHAAVVKRLLQDPRVDPSVDDNYAIALASGFGHFAVVKQLLKDPRVDPSAEDNYAIHWASGNGHLAIVNRLLQDPRVGPSYNGIQEASEEGHIEVVERLLQDPRVDPSENDNYAIRLASENGHLAVVNRLLEDSRVDPSVHGNIAIRSLVKRLLEDQGVDLT